MMSTQLAMVDEMPGGALMLKDYPAVEFGSEERGQAFPTGLLGFITYCVTLVVVLLFIV